MGQVTSKNTTPRKTICFNRTPADLRERVQMTVQEKINNYIENLHKYIENVNNFHGPIMLYLFDITKFPSNWMHLDMGLTAASVQTLKEHIQEQFKINVDDQVLLVSGGVCLDATKIVCHYSAGTDSNPIYFFNKKIDKNFSFPECPDVTSTTDDLSLLYKKLEKVVPSFQAVIDRADLAEKMAISARRIIDHCEEIIRDHHVANQGWLAAVANYDDVVSNCLRHYEEKQSKFEEYIKVRDYFLKFLEKFKEKLHLFKKIPIMQKLLRPHDTENRLMLGSETSEGLSEGDDNYTSFFDWVGMDEHGNSIDTIFKNCEEEVEFYKEESFKNAFNSVPQTLEAACSSNKEINVGFWLSHLDELINKAKGVVEEQNKISSSIQLNLARMKDCQDLSILPHLCETHEQELKVMNENHSILKDIENTCIKAKYEFTLNVQGRICWIVQIENELQRIGVQLDIFNESLERLKYQIDILEKIYAAPTAYFACIAETVRRRSYSQAFLMWASEMACRLHTMHNEEVARRKDFLSKYEDTFIQMLFPGLEDLPPNYGTEAPSYFDTSLPKLTVEDIDSLKRMLPDLPKELTEYLSLEESSNLSYLSFKSILNTQPEKMEEVQLDHSLDKKENQNEIVEKIVNKEGFGETSLTAIHGLPHLRDIDRGCESETDTEEFEKVGQSPLELNFNKEAASQKPITQDVSTSTEENLEICKSEYNAMRTIINQICTTASESIRQIKSEMKELKLESIENKREFLEYLQRVMMTYSRLCEEQKNHETSVVLRLTTEHANEINDFRRLAQVKNEEIKSLRTNMAFINNRLKNISEQVCEEKKNSDMYKKKCEELSSRLAFSERQKERSIKEWTDRLNREHEAKVKTLQSRFRLITMERTPSDSSLEKALECSTSSNHHSVYCQMQEKFELQKEAFIKEKMLSETEKWKKNIEELEQKFDIERRGFLESIEKMKEEEIKTLEEKEKQHLEIVQYYMDVIQQLNDEISNYKTSEQNIKSGIGKEMDKSGPSMNERSVSIVELQKEKTETVAMAGSYSEGKVDCATSPIKQRRSISKTVNVLGRSSRPMVNAMKAGDTLVIVWDEDYQNFRVVQTGPVIYFLSLECIPLLGLAILGGNPKRPNKLYCLAEYVHREFLYARKSENRFNVPQGTRFYRVKAKPLQDKTGTPPPVLQSAECSSSIHQESSIAVVEMEMPSTSQLPKWKYGPDQLPPDSLGIVQDNMPEDSKSSDNKSEDSSISIPFQTANYDFEDEQHDPVSTGDNFSESLS